MAFLNIDALLLVDVFAPAGSQADIQRFHRDADRVLRASANNTGRQRMRPDGTLREPKPPRGLVLSTGEDIPRGQSLRARVLVLEMKRTDLKWDHMTALQTAARNGLFAEALAGFIQWLAPRYEQIPSEFHAKGDELRRRGGGGETHPRRPTNGANPRLGIGHR